MDITAQMVKELRDRTGAGVMECRRALTEVDGNIAEAEKKLAEWAGGRVEKKLGRATNQGVVDSYIHGGGRIGSMVELNCETDFVARNEVFRQLAREIAMQVAAMNPQYVSPSDIPADEAGRPEDLALLSQPYIRDGSKTIESLIRDVIAKTGENIQVRRFARFELGA